MSDLGLEGEVGLRHGKLDVDPLVVGPPQFTLQGAIHFHGYQVHLHTNDITEECVKSMPLLEPQHWTLTVKVKKSS